MGLDIGGGGGRCLLHDTTDGSLIVASRPWAARCAPDTAGLGYELDLGTALADLAAASREAIERAAVDAGDIAGIACSAMRIGTVILGDNGPLFATTNRDARAVIEGLTLAGDKGAQLYARTGRWPYPIFPAARLQWLQANQPEIVQQARACLGLSDWLGWALTGAVATDPTQAGETLLYDLERRDWAADLIEELGLPAEIFPEIREPGTSLGSLGDDVAASFGLRAGTPVFVGAGDSQSAMLGAGVIRTGAFTVVGGTTAPVTVLTDTARLDPKQRLWSGHHLSPGSWMLESNAGPLGETLDWLAGVFHPSARAPVAKLLAEAAAAEPGQAGFFSTVGVQVQNAQNMGLPTGELTLTHVTTPDASTARNHVARAVADGLAYGIKANVAQLVEVSGHEPKELALAGGLSQSEAWSQSLADVLDLPVRVARSPHTSAFGAALLAGVGASVYTDLDHAAATASEGTSVSSPTPENVALHASLYEKWGEHRTLKLESTAKACDQAIPLALAVNEAAARPARSAFRPKILVTADMDEASLERLAGMGDVEYASFRQVSRLLTGPSLVEALAGVHVFITEVDLIDAAALEKLDDLRVVAACRSDAVNVNVAACTAFGIPVLNAPGRNAWAVADCAVAYVLMLARKLVAANASCEHRAVRPEIWPAWGTRSPVCKVVSSAVSRSDSWVWAPLAVRSRHAWRALVPTLWLPTRSSARSTLHVPTQDWSRWMSFWQPATSSACTLP
jgi:autoinducer 2 (AI-2) kinase